MKKNKTMRTAAVLGVTALLATSALSGTLAKYTTTNSGTDSATVAKFGVVINVNDDMGLFKTSYDEASDDMSANTVVSADTNRKIAPGTKGSMSFSISGKPEVATQLTLAVENAKTAHLVPGTYTLASGKFAEKDCQVITMTDYEPIKWYFGSTEIDENTKYDKTLAQLESSLETLTKGYKANEKIDATYYIGWKWDFEADTDVSDASWSYAGKTSAPYTGAKFADFLDTYLGDEANLQTEKFDLKISVTQVD